MSAVALPRGAGQHRARIRRSWPMRAARLTACALALALSAAAIRENMRFRVFEAWLAGHVISLAASVRAGAVPHAPIVWFADGPHRYFGLFITSECTVATLTVPFLLCTAWTVWQQSRFARPALALAAAVALLIAVQQLRLLAIAWLVIDLGYGSGFYWGHTLAGSLITVFGVVFVFFSYLLLVAGPARARRAPFKSARTHGG